ncbi:MAG: phenylalanine--tRNA ligase subunit beta [Betaproteobacteria bacterium]|nr:phenylalanine--tRNA ligase subunit beta [Betaproteobacteria bacterium]
MKFSEHWLRTFVDPPLTTRELAHALAMGGLDVEHVEPVAPPFDRVVVGEVLAVDKHPGADRLSVCTVNVGVAPLSIVCGAPNVRAGSRVPTALAGAKLPAIEIKVTSVRGVESHGMLCSARELGLSEDAAGLLELPNDAPIGADVRQVLDLDDHLITIKPTPNRGDCLGLAGIAREVSAITGSSFSPMEAGIVSASLDDTLRIELAAPRACPRYCGRLVRGVNAGAAAPRWVVERLTRSGIRSVSAIVDITNYVMLELGQPLHAFDAARIDGGICVRFAHEGEKLVLLNGENLEFAADFLVIADERKALALAGIMGGAESAVTRSTVDIFLESAFFDPEAIAGKSRLLGFGSDASYRFERGVDYAATRDALDRATRLVLEVCGGRAGPVSEACAALPQRKPVTLRIARAERILGIPLNAEAVAEIFRRLNFAQTPLGMDVAVTPPSFRFDITIEEDLIEEVARIHGYENIPAVLPQMRGAMLPAPEQRRDASTVRQLLVARDYQEVVTFGFVERQWEEDFCGNCEPLALANPIASHMSVMRSSLIGSLVNCVAFNASRRQPRVRAFEIGRCFVGSGDDTDAQPMRVGGIAYGLAASEQWGVPKHNADFFDTKSDVEALLAPQAVRFEAAVHPAFHPGRSARVMRAGRNIGWIGELHPRWQAKYDLPLAPLVFELDFRHVTEGELPSYRDISRFPAVRRDVSAEFDEEVGHDRVLAAMRQAAPAIVSEIGLFDVFRGGGVGKGKKSLAFRVLLQDTEKTLTEAEVDSAVAGLRDVLQQQFRAKLR